MNLRPMELRDTIDMMQSDDYKERFKAEYYQVEKRHHALGAILKKYKEKRLDFTPKCPIELLQLQHDHMGEYMGCLKIRADMEGIKL